jgi:hypothetical protein
MPDTRRTPLVLAAVALTATSVIGGRLGDLSLRDPRALATLAAMIAAFVAVLWAGDRPATPTPNLAICTPGHMLDGAVSVPDLPVPQGPAPGASITPPDDAQIPTPAVAAWAALLQTAEDERDQARAELAATNRDLDHARVEMNDLRDQLSIVIGQANALTANYVQARAELEQLRTALRDSCADLDRAAHTTTREDTDHACPAASAPSMCADCTAGMPSAVHLLDGCPQPPIAAPVSAAPAPESDDELLGGLDQPAYITTDNGHWLDCPLCDQHLIMIEAGVTLADLADAAHIHHCPRETRTDA